MSPQRQTGKASGVQVGILMGSDSDWPVIEAAETIFKEFGVGCEVHVHSAHRSPDLVRRYVTGAAGRGIKIIICGAGGAAHLAGVVAAHTTLPVIGIPVESKSLKGLDSLLATAQMPKGVPVATVAINGAANAALLAIQCLALSDARLAKALTAYKKTLAAKTEKADQGLQSKRR